MKYIPIVLLLIFVSCSTTSLDQESNKATITISTITPIGDAPTFERGFFVDIDSIHTNHDFGCCLKIYDPEYNSTMPKEWDNTYHGRITFDLEKNDGKWFISKQL